MLAADPDQTLVDHLGALAAAQNEPPATAEPEPLARVPASDALMAARYRSVRTVEHDGKRVTYATDAEMAAALADPERKIAADGGSRVAIVRIASSKGV